MRIIKNKQEMKDMFYEHAVLALTYNRKIVVVKSTLHGLLGFKVDVQSDSLNENKIKLVRGKDEKYLSIDVVIDKGSHIELKNANNTIVLEIQ